jgi:hypothetical protein
MKAMLGLRQWGMAVALALAGAAVMGAEEARTALVTQAQGTVQMVQADGKMAPVVSFSKLKPGTRISIGVDGRFQLVYLSTGQQETWGSSSQIETGDTESKPIKTSNLPTIKQLPAAILKGLTQAPAAIADITSIHGMIRVRTAIDGSKLETAEKNYKMLRAQAAEDDVTPELYLLAALSELKQVDRMKQPLEQMLKRQPASAEIRAVHAAFVKHEVSGAAK